MMRSKADLLQAGAELRVPIPVMIDILDQNSRIRRIPRQMVKAMHHLSELSMIAEVRLKESGLDVELETEAETVSAGRFTDRAKVNIQCIANTLLTM